MTVRIINADVMTGLRSLPDESVQCVVTSPPYFGLRSYLKDDHPSKHLEIGNEPTLEAHIEKLVEVFREVRRVLRTDGICWLNYGDAYCNVDKWGGGGGNVGKQTKDGNDVPSWAVRRKRQREPNLKPKDLMLIPFRLALALQVDGWWIRSRLPWLKPNGMPSSVEDRPGTSVEEIFMLTKSARYFYDGEAIKQVAKYPAGPNAPGKVKSPQGQGFLTWRGAMSKPRRRLTVEQCAQSAKKFDTRTAFAKLDAPAYEKAREAGWLDDVCAHMVRRVAPNNWWTKERCEVEARRFSSRSEFWRGMSGCYTQACRKGFIDEICAHMTPQSNVGRRYVYAIVSLSSDRRAYVGLTWNIGQRLKGHRSSRNIQVRQMLDGPHEVQMLSGPIEQEHARRAEAVAIKDMRDAGWRVVNRAPAGSLGGPRRKWTREACAAVAALCKDSKEFRSKFPVAYASACARGWLTDVAGHLPLIIRPANYWTKDRCAEAAVQCQTRREFRRRFDVARQIAQRSGWMDEICAHMRVEKRPNGYWTKDRCADEALKYATRGAFARGCPAAYDAAWKRGWLDEVAA